MLQLASKALAKYFLGLLCVGLLLFLPAGTVAYFNGWLLIALLFVPMFFLGLLLLFKSPDLLRKRLDSREKEWAQKGVVAFSGLLFIAGFVVAGLDHRFGWAVMPTWVIILGSVILLVSYALYAEVMRENAYLSRTVKVQDGQRVVDSGLYGIVRHPMYAVTLFLFVSFALVLGSLWSFLCFLGFVPLFVIRIVNEEKVLLEGLLGYCEYRNKVKYRLIPFIW